MKLVNMNEETAPLPYSSFAVLGIPIAKITMQQMVQRVNTWVDSRSTGNVVTFTNVHMVVEARLDPAFGTLLATESVNCPDGTPLFWIGRRKEGHLVEQVSGPDFMAIFCEQSVALGYRHYLYGGAPGVVEAAAQKLITRYPGIEIVGMHTPPFRPLTAEEDAEVIERINASGAQLVWVCLGCPKQEKWMFAHRNRLNAHVVLGTGQAIDILAGTRKRAPAFIRKAGLEWLYRLLREPGRLWKRYLRTNYLFVLWLVQDYLALLFKR